MSKDTCEHEAIETEIIHASVGRKWQQHGPVSYCPECRRWTKRTRVFLDGQFYKTDPEAREAQVAFNAQCREQRHAWLQEHYPEHYAALGLADAAHEGER